MTGAESDIGGLRQFAEQFGAFCRKVKPCPPAYLSMAGDDQTPISEITLNSMADWGVAGLARRSDGAILMGDSLGRMAISAAAEKVPERLKELGYLPAFLPRNGE